MSSIEAFCHPRESFSNNYKKRQVAIETSFFSQQHASSIFYRLGISKK